MTDISTDTATDVPEFPMTRAAGLPVRSPTKGLGAQRHKQLSRVRIWDGSTPWLIHGYDAFARCSPIPAPASTTDCPATRIGTRACWRRCTSGHVRSSPPMPRSTPDSAGCCQNPSPSSASKACARRCRRSPTNGLTPCWPAPTRATSSAPSHCPSPRWSSVRCWACPTRTRTSSRNRRNAASARNATEEDTAQGAASLAKYIANLIRARMQSPAENLVSDLAERVNAEELSVREATQLATRRADRRSRDHRQHDQPEHRGAARTSRPAALIRDADDPKIIAAAVEELMRYLSIIQTGQRRIAVEDIEVGGETIRAGEGIILDVAPANWDPRQFPDPDRLDLLREDGAHVGFGYGRHQCVGQQLARHGITDRPAHVVPPRPDAAAGGAGRGAPVQARHIGLRRL